MREKKTPRISIRISIAILAVLLIVVATLPVASADDWSYRKPITIYGSQVQGTVTNFPVLIYLESDSHLVASAQDNGGDIVFTNKANTVRYDHEIEKFVKSTGELVAWVEINSLSSTSDTEIYMWYGNPNCANQWNIEGTWNSNYKLVQHLNESCAEKRCIKDSTSNNNDGTPNTNLYTSSGKMNGADSFDGTDDYVDCGEGGGSLDFGTGDFTIAAWVKSTESQYRVIISKGDVYDERGRGYMIQSNHHHLRVVLQDGATHVLGETEGTQICDGSWHSIAVTFDRDVNAIYYVDGTIVKEVDISTFTGSTSNSYNLEFARKEWQGVNYFFGGTIDEVRISSVARSGDWIKTSYNNQNSPSTFYTVGAQQNAGPVPPVPDLPAIILFGAGLLVIVVYAVPRRRSRR